MNQYYAAYREVLRGSCACDDVVPCGCCGARRPCGRAAVGLRRRPGDMPYPVCLDHAMRGAHSSMILLAEIVAALREDGAS